MTNINVTLQIRNCILILQLNAEPILIDILFLFYSDIQTDYADVKIFLLWEFLIQTNVQNTASYQQRVMASVRTSVKQSFPIYISFTVDRVCI